MPFDTLFFRKQLAPTGKICPGQLWVAMSLFFDLPKTLGMLGQPNPENNTPWKINGKNLKILLIEKIEKENHLKETSIFVAPC